ncbi:phage tail protein [Providencia rettgeri]|uniref:phage tail protein n=1 Tax=Providencia rettgeri TaxID=587 RepID=UPI00223BC8CB|nr:phage tail protein [Providencia rettgeri]
MKYFALLTKLGENLLAQATALGTKLELTHMAVGDGGGSLPTPDTNQTKLIAEKRRAAINTLFIDDKNKNQIIAEQIIPEQDGGWWIREIGLFDKAGNLIAVANCPETYKPQLAEGSGRTQSIRMVLIVSHTESVTLKIDPSVVLATREYVNTEITVLDKKIDALSVQTKLDLNKKFDKANISGVLGNDNDKVPSLNLLATELGKKQPAGNYAPAGDYATNAALNNGLDKKLDKTGGVISGGLTVQSTISANKKLEAFNNELETYALLDVTENTPKVKTKQKGMPFYDHKFPDKSGVFMHLGDYGWGGEGDYTNVVKEFSTNDELIKFLQGAPTQTWRHQNDIPDGKYSFRYGASFIIKTLDTFLNISSSFNSPIIRITTGLKGNTANWLTYDLLHTKNTTTDSGGFVRTGNATALTTGHVAQSTGASTTNIMSQKATSDAIAGVKTLGDGQKWTDVKAQRQSGVTYTNTTGRTIALSVSTIGAQASSNVEIYVDNVLCSQNGFGGNANADFTRHTIGYAIIPTGSSYRVIASSLALWAELR